LFKHHLILHQIRALQSECMLSHLEILYTTRSRLAEDHFSTLTLCLGRGCALALLHSVANASCHVILRQPIDLAAGGNQIAGGSSHNLAHVLQGVAAGSGINERPHNSEPRSAPEDPEDSGARSA